MVVTTISTSVSTTRSGDDPDFDPDLGPSITCLTVTPITDASNAPTYRQFTPTLASTEDQGSSIKIVPTTSSARHNRPARSSNDKATSRTSTAASHSSAHLDDQSSSPDDTSDTESEFDVDSDFDGGSESDTSSELLTPPRDRQVTPRSCRSPRTLSAMYTPKPPPDGPKRKRPIRQTQTQTHHRGIPLTVILAQAPPHLPPGGTPDLGAGAGIASDGRRVIKGSKRVKELERLFRQAGLSEGSGDASGSEAEPESASESESEDDLVIIA